MLYIHPVYRDLAKVVIRRIYVFNAKDRSFLGYRELRGDTTRRFKTVTDKQGNTAFYTNIGAETGMTQNGEGPTVMLRWVGTPEAPFSGGTYHQGTSAGHSHFEIADPELFDQLTDTAAGLKAFLANEWRASSIFRMKLGDLQVITEKKKNPELLYGYKDFRVANEAGGWDTVLNSMGAEPMF